MIRRHYRPGSFLRVDDRTGFTVYAENTRKEWTGNIVRSRSWEQRQPQDFVRGVADPQVVPEPRPRTTPQFVNPGFGVLYLASDLYPQPAAGAFNVEFDANFLTGENYAAGGAVAYITNTTGLYVGQVIQIMLDTGDYFPATVTQVSSNMIGYAPRVTSQASAGNVVLNVSQQSVNRDFTSDFDLEFS